MIIINNKNNCCGCSACKNICPVNAITIKKDEEGFDYPIVDKSKCIGCNMCNNICPFINSSKIEIKEEVYGVHTKDKDLLLKSSSGGVFGEIAKTIISDKGKVFGVDYNYNYLCIDNLKDLNKILGSKYVQSNINDTFKNVKKELSKKIKVLFVGTPCVVNGLKNYLKVDYDNLITCDIICHGVPSEKLINKYKDSFKQKVTKIDFRNKSNGWKNYSIVISLENKTYKSLAIDNEYMRAFLNNYCLRYSCYSCKAKGINRKSDITLGDYWGIDSNDKVFNFNGTSIVVLNTQKGKELFFNIKDKFIYQKVNNNELKKNPAYYDSVNCPLERESFYRDLDNMTFKKLVKKYNLAPSKMRKLKIKIKNIMKG